MNILFLNSLGKSKWGGGEKWMINAGNGLANRGHYVIIACIKNSLIEQKSIEKGLNTWNFSIPADIAFWKGSELKKFLKQKKIDTLVCCQNKDVRIGARAARQIGIQAIFARQGIQNLRNENKYIKPFTKYVDGLITNTQSIKNIYESFGWFPKDFVHVIYNGVEIPDITHSINLHELYNLPKECFKVFSAGRLDRQKGFDLLIEVARKAKDQEIDWQIIIAGQGKLRDELTSLAKKRGVQNIIHFIGFSDQISSLIKASNVFVLPSRYEGMPNALLEAMALGKANVATNVNGASELVEDGESGFLVESENPDQLFEKLKELHSNETLRNSIGEKALLRVKTHFTVKKMIDNLEKLFSEQIQKSSND